MEKNVKINNFRIHVSEVQFGGKTYNPRVLWKRKQAVFIEIEDANGVIGWGECWTFDSSADALIRFIQTEIRPIVLEKEFPSISVLWQELWSNTVLSGRHGMAAAALSGLDCALWDIAARHQGKSLGEAISNDETIRPVPVYASGGLYQMDVGISSLRTEMKQYVEAGYKSVKMKIGAAAFETDVERVRAVREEVGPNTKLILDAVYSLDRSAAERWIPEWKAAKIEAIQAPFAARDWASMQWLNRDCKIPVMVFEAESRYVIFRALLEKQAIGILQFSPIAVGGITASLDLIKLAQQFNCQVSLQCSSTWLAEMIALQIASVNKTVRHVEMHRFHTMLFDDADNQHLRLEDGCVNLGETKGLGFIPPSSQLTSFDATLPDSIKIGNKFAFKK